VTTKYIYIYIYIYNNSNNPGKMICDNQNNQVCERLYYRKNMSKL
jgi:hypothetical protein